MYEIAVRGPTFASSILNLVELRYQSGSVALDEIQLDETKSTQ